MDNQIVASKQSPLLSNLANSELQDLSYSLDAGAPLLANSIFQLAPQSTSTQFTPGTELQWLIPQAYFLKDLMIRSSITTANSKNQGSTVNEITGISAVGTATVAHFTASTLVPDIVTPANYNIVDLYPKVGLRLFEYIAIRTASGRELCRFDSSYLRSYIETLPMHVAAEVYKKAMLLDPVGEQPVSYLSGSVLTPVAGAAPKYNSGFGTTAGIIAGTNLITYTPIFWSMFDSVKTYLDLGFIEQIIVAAKFQSTSAKMGFASDESTLPQLNQPTLQMSVVKYSEEFVRVLREENFPAGQVLQVYNSGSYTETFTVAATSNTFSQRLNSTYPSTSMHVTVRDPVTQILLPITNISLTIAGQIIFDSIHLTEHSKLWTNNGRGGFFAPTYDYAALDDQVTAPSGPTNVSTGTTSAQQNAYILTSPYQSTAGAFVLKAISNRAFPFVFNLDPGDRCKCSGAIALRQLNGTTLTINMVPVNSGGNAISSPALLATSPALPSAQTNYEIAVSYCTAQITSFYSDSGLVLISQLY